MGPGWWTRGRRSMAAAALLIAVLLAQRGAAQAEDAQSELWVEGDVLAAVDVYARLPSSALHLQHLAATNYYHIMDRLRSKQLETHVQVVLVGFDGNGPNNIRLDPKIVHSKLGYLQLPIRPTALSGPSRELPLEQRYSFGVSHAPKAFFDTLAEASRAYGASATRHYEAIDTLIRNEHHRANVFPAIFLLNLPSSTSSSSAYAYGASASDQCGSSLFVGQERYAWFDVNALMVAKEPAPNAPSEVGDVFQGSVIAAMIPRAARFQSSMAFQTDHLESHLAAFIGTIVEHTLVPPVGRLPYLPGGRSVSDANVDVVIIPVAEGARDLGISAIDVSKRFGPMHYPGRQLRFGMAKVSALQTQAFLAQVVAATYDEGPKRRIDADLLRTLILAHKSFPTLVPRKDTTTRFVPMVIIHAPENVLFDSPDQLFAAFDDMILVLANTEAHTAHYRQFACAEHVVATPPGPLDRAVTGALLASLWGVGAPHVTWSPLHNASVPDYVFATGHTPFGPFGGHTRELSFTLKDSIMRNLILAHFDQQFRQLDVWLGRLEAVADHLGNLAMDDKDMLVLAGRLSVLHGKWDYAVEILAHGHLKHAVYWIRAAIHDVNAIERVAEDVLQKAQMSRACHTETDRPYVARISWLLAVLQVMVTVGLVGLAARHLGVFGFLLNGREKSKHD